MIDALTFLGVVIAAIVFALLEARDDAKTIRANKGRGDRKELDHDKLVQERVLFLLCAVVGATLIASGKRISWAHLFNLASITACAWSVFTMSHRFLLNVSRRLDHHYLSPGNRYDRHWITFQWMLPKDPVERERDHRSMYFGEIDDELTIRYRSAIHRAGRAAYRFEFIIAAASVVAFTFTNI